MPTMSPTPSNVELVRVKGPNLDDEKKYVKIPSVPIFDIHTRKFNREFKDDYGRTYRKDVEETVDEAQLETIARNTQSRAEAGEYGIVFLGHTSDEGPETEQPPVVGFMKNYRVGKHGDRAAMLADIYIKGDKDKVSDLLFQYPRRSAEVIRKNRPDGYVDSVALIKRAPERPLGVMADLYQRSNKEDVDRFMCPDCENEIKSKDGGDMPLTISNEREFINEIVKMNARMMKMMLDKLLGDEGEDAKEEEADPGIHDEIGEPDDAAPETESEKESALASGVETPSQEEKGDDEEEDRDEYCNASAPSATNVTTPSMNIKKNERDRMRKEQSTIEIERYRQREEALTKRLEALEKRNSENERKARLAGIERNLIQMEAEGYSLDRVRVMDRFSKRLDSMTEEDVKDEIDFYRSTFSKSPVGQPLIFGGDVETEDVGGNSDRPERYAASAQTACIEHERYQGVYGEKSISLVKAEEITKDASPIELATMAYRRARESRKKA